MLVGCPLKLDQSELSPLNSSAVVWRVTPLFAEWISSPQNILFHSGTLDSRSVVLELGAGISGLVGLALAPKIRRYIVTDQEYVLKLLQENIDANQPHWTSSSKSKGRAQRIKDVSNIDVLPLDWETSSMSKLYSQLDLDQEHKSIDALVSCDCIYNEALVEPLVQTSRDICSLAPADRLTICIVAQQLRSSEVFELWLESFHKYFRVWRVPDSILDVELQLENGFAVHIGVLRDEAGIKKQ